MLIFNTNPIKESERVDMLKCLTSVTGLSPSGPRTFSPSRDLLLAAIDSRERSTVL